MLALRSRVVASCCAAILTIAWWSTPATAQPAAERSPDGMVVFQAFWWDCWNDLYPPDKGGWYTYLAALAPRLREMGVDALYLPPPSKGDSGSFSMGYDVFDHYDLGSKDQEGTVPTRFGTQDDLLRLVAVAHANGMDVVFDTVLNHCRGDGGDKRFRYRAFGGDGAGRWPKGPEDFHGNSQHAPANDAWREENFGRDVCYRGRCKDNPADPDTSTYMRDEAVKWLAWLTRQTDADGYRFDAVKHFPPEVVRDALAVARADGRPYYAVGEFVVSRGGQGAIDDWSRATVGRAGTLDFALRDALLQLSRSDGFFDLRNLPGDQQQERRRTSPFVNNHDTWRGRYWDSGAKDSLLHDDRLDDFGKLEEPPAQFGELAATVDIDLPRARLAYAFALAVDGSPVVFYEDLLVNNRLVRADDPLPDDDPGEAADPDADDGTTRFRPDPANVIPRGWLGDLLRAHRLLGFKRGRYMVPVIDEDMLVVEREGRAIIALNDNGASDKTVSFQTSFPGATLKAFTSSADPAPDAEVTTDAAGNVAIRVPKAGYVVYGPADVDPAAQVPFQPRATAQVFEFAEDVGDSAATSLGYGGRLAAGVERVAGSVYAATGSTVTVVLTPQEQRSIKVRLYKPVADGTGDKIDRATAGAADLIEFSGTADPDQPLTRSFTADREGYHQIAAMLDDAGAAPVAATVKVIYTAPAESQNFRPRVP